MNQIAIEIEVEDGSIDVNKFWELVDDLLYTKVYFDPTTNQYFSRHFSNLCIDDELMLNRSNLDEQHIYYDKEIEKCSEDEINTLLVSFIALTAKYSSEVSKQIGDEEFYSTVAKFIMNFKYYQTHSDFCIRKMLSLLMYAANSNLNNLKLDANELNEELTAEVNESIETNEKFIKVIGWIFYTHYRYRESEILEILRDYNGFTALLRVIKNYVAISKTNNGRNFTGGYKNFMLLLCALGKSFDLTSEVGKIDPKDLSYILSEMKLQAEAENEVNFWAFRMLLVLNEQYIYQCGLKIYYKDKVNIIIDMLLKDMKKFQKFTEMLVFNFNREVNLVDQILIMKFLYVIFSNDETSKLFYLNDIKIIVDIMIRELNDLQLQVSEYLVNIYLRVLQCMLANTDLSEHCYKVHELEEVLNYLIHNEEASDKTKKLAKRCLKCDFFKSKKSHSVEMLKSFDKMKLSSTMKSASLPDLKANDVSDKLKKKKVLDYARNDLTHSSPVPLPPPAPAKVLNHETHSLTPILPISASSTNIKNSIPPPPPPARTHSSLCVDISLPTIPPYRRTYGIESEEPFADITQSTYSSNNSSGTSLGLNVPSGTTYDESLSSERFQTDSLPNPQPLPLPSPSPPPPPPPRGSYRVDRADSVVSIDSEISSVSTGSNSSTSGSGPGTGTLLSIPSNSISARTRYKGKPPPPPPPPPSSTY